MIISPRNLANLFMKTIPLRSNLSPLIVDMVCSIPRSKRF